MFSSACVGCVGTGVGTSVGCVGTGVGCVGTQL